MLENISPVPTEPVAGPSSEAMSGPLPPLTVADKSKFRKIFMESGSKDGLLAGTHDIMLLDLHCGSPIARAGSSNSLHEVQATLEYATCDMVSVLRD